VSDPYREQGGEPGARRTPYPVPTREQIIEALHAAVARGPSPSARIGIEFDPSARYWVARIGTFDARAQTPDGAFDSLATVLLKEIAQSIEKATKASDLYAAYWRG
jgi:hypothetical protein